MSAETQMAKRQRCFDSGSCNTLKDNSPARVLAPARDAPCLTTVDAAVIMPISFSPSIAMLTSTAYSCMQFHNAASNFLANFESRALALV